MGQIREPGRFTLDGAGYSVWGDVNTASLWSSPRYRLDEHEILGRAVQIVLGVASASASKGSPTLAWGRGRRSMVWRCSPSINQSYKVWPN